MDEYPHPEVDFLEFVRVVETKNSITPQTWDPLDKKNKHWVDPKKLASIYGKKGCAIS